ncbi:MAG TPA: DUF2142 domain-containing protein [Stellaceae bacterium]|nr:DUF2142 domain-containing protein [Stellaceae bacterium]
MFSATSTSVRAGAARVNDDERTSVDDRPWFAGLPERFATALPALYIAWAMSFVLALCWLTPPYRNVDEINHYLRAVQIARGELTGYRLFGLGHVATGDSGGRSDPGIVASSDPFSPDKPHSVPWVRKPDFQTAASAFFGPDELIGFGNTAVYPPFLYLPSVVSIWIGETVGLTILKTLYLARAANMAAAISISTLAMFLARRTRWAIAAVALLPMTAALYASVNQDGLIIALALLVVAMVDRIGAEQRPASNAELAALVAVAALAAMAKPPYGVMALFPFAVSPGITRREFGAAAAIVACTAAWTIFTMATASVNIHGAVAALQFRYVVTHPFVVLPIAWQTLTAFSRNYFHEFIGVLGWLDTPLPRWFVRGAGIALAASFLGACAAPPGPRPWLPLMIAIGGVGAVFAAEYLVWTRPFAPFVDGVQGRYFVPLAPVLALALPAAPRRISPVLPWLAMAGIVVLAVFGPAVVIRSIVLRYYLCG